jgi:hypothetical protein
VLTETTWQPAELMRQGMRVTWRIRYRNLVASFVIECEALGNPTTNAALRSFGTLLWSECIAPLLSRQAFCTYCTFEPLSVGGPLFLFSSDTMKGAVFGNAAPQNDAAVVVMWTGGPRGEANTRRYLPFVAAQFVRDRQLTPAALYLTQTLMRGVALGMDGRRGGVGPSLITYQAFRPADRWSVERPARFASVAQIICCSYTDRPPYEGLRDDEEVVPDEP